MNIIVCVKRVPDTEARIKLTDGDRAVDPSGVKFVLNPYDEFAVEAALKHRDAAGGGKVTVLSLGPAAAAETLRTALAMGADDAVLLQTDATVSGLPVARALADEISGREHDLLLFGLKAIDDDLQATCGMVAELLDLPAATAVAEFSVEEGRVEAKREIEGGSEIVELPTPCALSITKGAYEPRYPSLKGIMAAKRKPLEQKDVQVQGGGLEVESFAYPEERTAGRIVGEGPEAVPELLRLLREEARVL